MPHALRTAARAERHDNGPPIGGPFLSAVATVSPLAPVQVRDSYRQERDVDKHLAEILSCWSSSIMTSDAYAVHAPTAGGAADSEAVDDALAESVTWDLNEMVVWPMGTRADLHGVSSRLGVSRATVGASWRGPNEPHRRSYDRPRATSVGAHRDDSNPG